MKLILLCKLTTMLEPALIKLLTFGLTLSMALNGTFPMPRAFNAQTDQTKILSEYRRACKTSSDLLAIDPAELNSMLDVLSLSADSQPQHPLKETFSTKALSHLPPETLKQLFTSFCTELPQSEPVDLVPVIDSYNAINASLPTDEQLIKRLEQNHSTVVVDKKGNYLSNALTPGHMQGLVTIEHVPPLFLKAIVAAEDKAFMQHHGVNSVSVLRATLHNLMSSKRPQGGSTLTQQLIKNAVLNDELSIDRKIKEMLLASRLEEHLTKDQILVHYLNCVYFGRHSWGLAAASYAYFNKPYQALTLNESAFLAGVVKGPNLYEPSKHYHRALERRNYVLRRMHEDGYISKDLLTQTENAKLQFASYNKMPHHHAYYYMDTLKRELQTLIPDEQSMTFDKGYTIVSTLNLTLQERLERIIQNELTRYELKNVANTPIEPIAHLKDSTLLSETALQTEESPNQANQWTSTLELVKLPYYDIQWPIALILDINSDGNILIANEQGETTRVPRESRYRSLTVGDVVYVGLQRQNTKLIPVLMSPPKIQGASVILENSTGRILALVGGFSYPMSQLNRVTQSVRQPGSTLKPLIYLLALSSGLSPDTRISNDPVRFEPLDKGGHAWMPKNYERHFSGTVPLHTALEQSKNVATAHLLYGGIEQNPEDSLDRVCEAALEFNLYAECERVYPFILGAQPLRMIDLANLYLGIKNFGNIPSPYTIDSISHGSEQIYTHQDTFKQVDSITPYAYYQIQKMLQNAVDHGTASQLRRFATFFAAKTGTSSHNNDAWIAGFTESLTILVWVGYDNGEGRAQTLGPRQTGGTVVSPIVEKILDSLSDTPYTLKPLKPRFPDWAEKEGWNEDILLDSKRLIHTPATLKKSDSFNKEIRRELDAMLDDNDSLRTSANHAT